VGVDRAGGHDQPGAVHELGRRSDDQCRVDAVHDVGVAGLADPDEPPVADADVGLDDAPVVEHHDVGHHQIRRAPGTRGVRLALRLPAGLATTEDGLVAPDAVILLDLDEQIGVGQAQPVAGRRAQHRHVHLPLDLSHRSAPGTRRGSPASRAVRHRG
jgi:hypothetical protein